MKLSIIDTAGQIQNFLFDDDVSFGGIKIRKRVNHNYLEVKTGDRCYPYTDVHRWIMGVAPDGKVVDHIDRDKHNNTRTNLRFVTVQENAWNRVLHNSNKTRLRGVRKQSKGGKKFEAYIFTNTKKQTHLGTFVTKEAAAHA